MLLCQIFAYNKHEKYKKSYKSSKLTISGPTWNEKCELSVRLYCLSDIQNYFKYITKETWRINRYYSNKNI